MKAFNFGILFSLLIVSFKSFADKPRVKGYYVNTDGDTVKALIEVELFLFNKKKVSMPGYLFGFKYFEKGKEYQMEEKDVQAFGFTYMGEKFEFRFVKEITIPGVMGHMNATGTFLRLLEKGNCDLYFATSVDGRSEEYFFRRGDNDFYLTKNSTSMTSHDKELATFFADCSTLADKIKKKEYKGDDNKYLNMAKYYNTSCN